MSRRTVTVEDFDDDTDLPLPSRPLPSSRPNGPLLEEVTDMIDYEDVQPRVREKQAGSASSTPTPFRPTNPNVPPQANVTDITPYKNWTCIYPIYIDAKRKYGTGERRVERIKSVWWPLSKDIADATNRLGLATLHEVNKAHPRDWENPGRVRVQWKKDGKLVNPAIKTKKQLLEMIALYIQRNKPDFIPKPPYETSPPKLDTSVPTTKPSLTAKGKQPANKSKANTSAAPPKHPSGHRIPVPPEPQPPLASRISPYSPALPSGVLVDTVKAGMNAQEANAAAIPGAPGAVPGAAAQKGKRKVVRVRG